MSHHLTSAEGRPDPAVASMLDRAEAAASPDLSELAHEMSGADGSPPPEPEDKPRRSGGRILLVTDDEVQSSAGELQVGDWLKDGEPIGKRLTVDNGTVVGWLLLRLSNLEEQIAAQNGLMYAAGQEVQRLRAELAKKNGGLLVPGR